MTQSKQWRTIPTNLTEDQFEEFIFPHLTSGKRGPKTTLSAYTLFNYILSILYTGCQWKELFIEKDSSGIPEIHYTRVYRVFRRWERDGCFEKIFEHSVHCLNDNNLLDTSVIHGDGTTTAAKKGGIILDIAAINT